MGFNKINRKKERIKKHLKIRQKFLGTKKIPRLCIYKSNTKLIAQIIDDENNKVLVSKNSSKRTISDGILLAKEVSDLAKKAKIKKVVFDRSGYVYHGIVKEFANACRKNGLEL